MNTNKKSNLEKIPSEHGSHMIMLKVNKSVDSSQD